MTIPFTTSGSTAGLFNRIGQIGQIVADVQALIGNGLTLATDVTNLLNLYEGSSLSNAEPDLVATVPTQANNSKIAVVGIDSALAQVAATTVERMVFRDNPISTRTNILTNLNELIRQMQANAATVQRCTVTGASAPVTGYTNVGTGVVVLSVKRGDGLTQENTLAETGRLTCTGDAQGGGTAGSETFQYLGAEAQTNPFHYEWPLGSGASATLQSVNATKNNSAGNLLTNSSWGTVTNNVPANWVDTLSLAGTDFFRETTNVYGTDTNALRFTGGTGHTPAITQQFNLSTGTLGATKADTQYAFNIAMTCNAVPPSGTFVFELIDQNGNVILDDQGVANQFTVNLNSLTTSYAFRSTTFRMPKTLPTSTRIRYRIGTPIPAGGYNVYLAHSAMNAMTKLYAGGPSVSIFSGGTNWILNDKFTLTFTNDRGGSVNQKTFQSLFDRLFSMRLNELLLPSSATPSISDSLI